MTPLRNVLSSLQFTLGEGVVQNGPSADQMYRRLRRLA